MPVDEIAVKLFHAIDRKLISIIKNMDDTYAIQDVQVDNGKIHIISFGKSKWYQKAMQVLEKNYRDEFLVDFNKDENKIVISPADIDTNWRFEVTQYDDCRFRICAVDLYDKAEKDIVVRYPEKLDFSITAMEAIQDFIHTWKLENKQDGYGTTYK